MLPKMPASHLPVFSSQDIKKGKGIDEDHSHANYYDIG